MNFAARQRSCQFDTMITSKKNPDMVFMTGADSWSKNTMKNTIDDANYIINWSFLLLFFNVLRILPTPTLL